MSTLLVNIEMVLNNKPITPITRELADVEIPTPRHFLIGNSLSSFSHWNLVKGLRDIFWLRWSKEYLKTILLHFKWKKKLKKKPNLLEEDLVMNLDPSLITCYSYSFRNR